jgi:hydrogenase maturation protein HypF
VLALPYDRVNTTMRAWPLDAYCDAEYHDPANRRFHAQPVVCPVCGPNIFLREEQQNIANGWTAIERAAELLREGKIVAVKGLGGYHLACDARNAASNAALRERKYRKEKPFAVMARDIEVARQLIALTPDAEALLTSQACPIVLAPARIELEGVAPENRDLGVMLPYTPCGICCLPPVLQKL